LTLLRFTVVATVGCYVYGWLVVVGLRLFAITQFARFAWLVYVYVWLLLPRCYTFGYICCGWLRVAVGWLRWLHTFTVGWLFTLVTHVLQLDTVTLRCWLRYPGCVGWLLVGYIVAGWFVGWLVYVCVVRYVYVGCVWLVWFVLRVTVGCYHVWLLRLVTFRLVTVAVGYGYTGTVVTRLHFVALYTYGYTFCYGLRSHGLRLPVWLRLRLLVTRYGLLPVTAFGYVSFTFTRLRFTGYLHVVYAHGYARFGYVYVWLVWLRVYVAFDLRLRSFTGLRLVTFGYTRSFSWLRSFTFTVVVYVTLRLVWLRLHGWLLFYVCGFGYVCVTFTVAVTVGHTLGCLVCGYGYTVGLLLVTFTFGLRFGYVCLRLHTVTLGYTHIRLVTVYGWVAFGLHVWVGYVYTHFTFTHTFTVTRCVWLVAVVVTFGWLHVGCYVWLFTGCLYTFVFTLPR